MYRAQAVYTALKETEQRATDVLPLWKLPFLHPLIPRQRKAAEAVGLIRQTTEQLIAQCRAMVDAEEQVPLLFQQPPWEPFPCICSSHVCAVLLALSSSSGKQDRGSFSSAEPCWMLKSRPAVAADRKVEGCLAKHVPLCC